VHADLSTADAIHDAAAQLPEKIDGLCNVAGARHGAG
jgi:short-subunit dehydrogenase